MNTIDCGKLNVMQVNIMACVCVCVGVMFVCVMGVSL